ncbi:uncharacterized protein BDV17DRAFT_270942 [Aspergillus undulatus]|uniref:uncharacterized protein n=1 Tax=Aspergillus undulatus TaxID=1810928 RepID=UPI003CCE50C0
MMSGAQKICVRIGTPSGVSGSAWIPSSVSACRQSRLGTTAQRQCRASNISLSLTTHRAQEYINLEGSCFSRLLFFTFAV